MNKLAITFAAIAATAAVSAIPASATTYVTRASFTAATTSTTQITFNDAPASGAAPMTNFTRSGVTFSAASIYILPSNYVSTPIFSSNYLEWEGVSPRLLTITFNAPVSAVGFDFAELRGMVAPLTISVNGQTFSPSTLANSSNFFGYTSASTFTSMTLSMPGTASAQSIFPILDTFTFGATAAVPETATWAMMIAGFGMVGFSLRSRRSTAPKVAYA